VTLSGSIVLTGRFVDLDWSGKPPPVVPEAQPGVLNMGRRVIISNRW